MRRFGALSRGCASGSLAIFGATFLMAGVAHAADLPGARLTVQRAEAANACPTEDDLATLVRARAGETSSGFEPLSIDVVIAPDGRGFSANVRVHGRRQGERVLRADGPTCDGLQDALVISLLLVLDNAFGRSDPGPGPTSASPPKLDGRTFERAPSARKPTAVSGWVAAGVALTHGLPTSWSLAAVGDFGLQWKRGTLWVGGFWSPERTQTFAPGSIDVYAYGARLRGCYRLFEPNPRMRLSGCAFGLGLALRGTARGFTADSSRVRPWWLTGLGPDFHWLFTPRFALGGSLGVLFTVHRERFSVENLGSAYDTDSVVGWAGVDANFRIW